VKFHETLYICPAVRSYFRMHASYFASLLTVPNFPHRWPMSRDYSVN